MKIKHIAATALIAFGVVALTTRVSMLRSLAGLPTA